MLIKRQSDVVFDDDIIGWVVEVAWNLGAFFWLTEEASGCHASLDAWPVL